MKNIFILLCLSLAFSLACTEKLDIEPTSYDDIDEAISTSDGLKSLMNGSYANARYIYGRYWYHIAELLPDTGEILFLGTYEEFHDLSNKSLVPTFYYSEDSWRYAYRAINGCNLVLENLDIIEDEDERAELEGHVRFIRGTLYLDLVRFFSLPYGSGALTSYAVPLVTEGVMHPDQIIYPSKASVQQVFDLVENDLLLASQLLPDEETFYANKYAAFAMLSRLYLTTNDFQRAAAMADSVITSGMFELTKEPFLAYNQTVNTDEDIMTWQQTELDNEGSNNDGMATFYASTEEVGRSEMVISEDFIASTYGADDLRGNVQSDVYAASDIKSMFYVGFGQRPRGVYTAKWLDYKTNTTFIRLAEMYLTRAEANQMQLDAGGAITGDNTPSEDIAIIRQRAGIDVTGMPEVTLDEIRLERYKELIFEGHRLHDNKRWQHNVGDISWDSERIILPVPKKETDTNPNL